MHATIKYKLSTAGQKASILAGGDGKAEQTLTVASDHPLFRDVVAAGDVDSNGNVLLNMSGTRQTYPSYQYWPEWAELPTVENLLATVEMEKRKDADLATQKKREEEERAARQLVEDEATLTTFAALPLANRLDGEIVKSPSMHDYSKLESHPAWIEAVAERDRRIIQRKANEQAKKEAAEAAWIAWRRLHGLEEEDTCLRVENGALASVPYNCWESHRRGKNWMAVISPNPSSPGGLERDFAEKAKGDFYYMLPALSPGDAVEFGADYYSGGGRKNPHRWYGYYVRSFVSQTDSPGEAEAGTAYVVLRKCSTGKAACKEGDAFAKDNPVAPTCTDSEGKIVQEIDQAIAAVNAQPSQN